MNAENSYRICFITMRGWKLVDGRWEKEGCKRELTFNEKESNDYSARHNLGQRYFGKDFLLDDAYEYQLYSVENPEPMTVTHRQYNNGDQIWFTEIGDKTLVVRVITYDGVTWLLGDKALMHPYRAPAL
jgi:hypothetical protein